MLPAQLQEVYGARWVRWSASLRSGGLGEDMDNVMDGGGTLFPSLGDRSANRVQAGVMRV
jgi:hypothetical protein